MRKDEESDETTQAEKLMKKLQVKVKPKVKKEKAAIPTTDEEEVLLRRSPRQ